MMRSRYWMQRPIYLPPGHFRIAGFAAVGFAAPSMHRPCAYWPLGQAWACAVAGLNKMVPHKNASDKKVIRIISSPV
jgi:hypothetical protein